MSWRGYGPWPGFRGSVVAGLGCSVTALREFGRYVRRLEQRSRGRVRYFAVAAKSPVSGRVHVHAVMGFASRLPIAACGGAWRAGHSKVTRYDGGLGGGGYIARHLGIEGAEVDLRP